MRNVVAVRIDERLIHGQVMTSWMKLYSPTSILIIDSASAKNPFLSRILFAAAPKNVELHVFDEESAAAFLGEESESGERLMVLSKTPGPLLKVMGEGVMFPEIILGNMGGAPGRRRFNKNISASDAEIEDYRAIESAGTPIFCQMVPSDSKESIASLL